MDCREFRELLGDEVDGRLAAADAARLSEHVASCASCAEERRELASLRATFRAMPRPAVPADFRSQVMERLPRGRVVDFPRALGWIAAVAAVAVVAVTIVIRGGSVAERDMASAPAMATRRAGERAADRDAEVPHAAREAEEKATPDEVLALRAESDDESRSNKKLDDTVASAPERKKQEAGEAPAPSPAPTAPSAAAPSQPAPPPGDAGRGRSAPAPAEPAPAAAQAKAPSGQAANVRYVVFRDEAAAQRFAASLRVPVKHAESEKSADAKAKATSKPAAPDADKADLRRDAVERRAASVVEEAAFLERRVVARETVAPAMTDKDVESAVAAAGGRAVPAADAARFGELLDAPLADSEGVSATASTTPQVPADSREPSDPPPPATGGPQSPGGGAFGPTAKDGGAPSGGGGAGPTSGGGGGGGGKATGAAAAKTRAPAPRVIIIVVLSAPAPPPTAPTGPGGGK